MTANVNTHKSVPKKDSTFSSLTHQTMLLLYSNKQKIVQPPEKGMSHRIVD